MSTQFYTDPQAPYSQTTNPQAPRHQRGGPSSFRTWALVIGAAVAAAIVALTVVLAGSHSSAAPATTGASSSTSSPANTTPSTPSHPVTPVQPSAAVMQLQRELGQLNYYEGPVDGLMGPQTTAAIQDLQRQAGLPQTGVMNAATQAALANYLAHGNNQMGGNS
jgi:peptidoglycan hydrolase-like protein with peptidoglycan-binding domain